ncbi:hypothetical protein BCV69DRAFT_300962 [Microstroma glucosiphilum]|uniref:Uncharacterized protein n=1 Tax=Pseudomicrostroma glucosiphilum TaxID=1684307 RepID=A0A316U1T8_9BASI|nr:hypothetical protein BCV69DRAFT_300962 [Pseudomicrostroma glucosiphilum]PWN18808.1 hypothetical protein BCV69DRAFT_300962 [Pseudomicrostroma glucosiphilum]
MKAFLTRRPSTAPSVRGLHSDSTHALSSRQQQDDEDFYYPALPLSSTTYGQSRSRAERSLPSAGQSSGSGSGAGHDIGSVPASRAPPSSWARNKTRFSLSRTDSSSSRRSLKTTSGGNDAKWGTIGARSGPGVIFGRAASYDDANTVPLRRRGVPPKHDEAVFEKTPHPTVFVVTNANGDEETDGTERKEAVMRGEISRTQSLSDGSCTNRTINDSRVTLLEALEQHPDMLSSKCSADASAKDSGATATWLPMSDDAESQAPPRRTATVNSLQRGNASSATSVTLGSMFRGLRRKASLPVLSFKPSADESVADPMRQALLPKSCASSNASHRPAMSPIALASELSDLAISHGNGLLNDAEYRILRKGLFEVAQKSLAVSVTGSAISTSFSQEAGSALDAGPSTSGPIAISGGLRRLPEEVGDPNDTQAALPSTSLRERRGVSKPGGTGQHDAQQLASASSPSRSDRERAHLKQSSSSIHSANSTTSSPFPDRRSLLTDASHSPSRLGSLLRKERSPRSGPASIASSQVSSKRRFRGPTKEEEQERMRELERIVQETRSVKSLKLTSASARKHDPPSSPNDEKGRTPNGASILAGADVPPIPVASTSFLAMAVGLDEQDIEYREKSSELIQAEIRVLQAEGDRVTKAFDVLESNVLEKGRSLLQGDASADGEGDAATRLHWLRTGERPVSTDKAAVLPRRRKEPPSTPPSAFRRLDGPLVTTPRANAHRALSATAQVHDTGRNAEQTAWELSSQLKTLRNELEIVESGKRDVVRRYDDRIAFLRSKERAAKIREGFA